MNDPVLILSALTIVFGGGLFWKLLDERRRLKEKEQNELKTKGGKLIRSVKVKVGDFIEIQKPGGVLRISCLKITQRTIKERNFYEEKETWVAEIKFDGGGNLFFPSETVLRNGVNTFFMPLMDSNSIVYELFHSDDRVWAFMAYIDHIDREENAVHIQVAIAYGQ